MMKVMESPLRLLYMTGMLLCNLRNFIFPNQISSYFKCSPPTLKNCLEHKVRVPQDAKGVDFVCRFQGALCEWKPGSDSW